MAKIAVAPLVGAWIEIIVIQYHIKDRWSLPSWERGLKFMGQCFISHSPSVAPLVGAWIEIEPIHDDHGRRESLPSWERGLKYK